MNCSFYFFQVQVDRQSLSVIDDFLIFDWTFWPLNYKWFIVDCGFWWFDTLNAKSGNAMLAIEWVSGAGTNLKVEWGAHVQREAPEKFLLCPSTFFRSRSTISLLESAFVMVSTVWSVSCLLFSYWRCPHAQPFVKVGARASGPYGVGAGGVSAFKELVTCTLVVSESCRPTLLHDNTYNSRRPMKCVNTQSWKQQVRRIILFLFKPTENQKIANSSGDRMPPWRTPQCTGSTLLSGQFAETPPGGHSLAYWLTS